MMNKGHVKARRLADGHRSRSPRMTSRTGQKSEEYTKRMELLDAMNHGMEAVNTLAIISSFLFAFAFTLWYEIDEDYFQDNDTTNALFFTCLAMSIILSGFATIAMTTHYYALKNYLQNVLSSRLQDAPYYHFRSYVNRNSLVRNMSEISVFLSLMFIYFSLIFYTIHKFESAIIISVTLTIFICGLILNIWGTYHSFLLKDNICHWLIRCLCCTCCPCCSKIDCCVELQAQALAVAEANGNGNRNGNGNGDNDGINGNDTTLMSGSSLLQSLAKTPIIGALLTPLSRSPRAGGLNNDNGTLNGATKLNLNDHSDGIAYDAIGNDSNGNGIENLVKTFKLDAFEKIEISFYPWALVPQPTMAVSELFEEDNWIDIVTFCFGFNILLIEFYFYNCVNFRIFFCFNCILSCLIVCRVCLYTW